MAFVQQKIFNSSRPMPRQHKKKSKETKKRLRSDSIPVVVEEIKIDKERKMFKKPSWKSLPRPSKVSHSHSDLARNKDTIDTRRSLSIEEMNKVTDLENNLGSIVEENSSETSSKNKIEVREQDKCSTWSGSPVSNNSISSNTPHYNKDFLQHEQIAVTSTGTVFRASSTKNTKEFYAIKKISFPHFDESQKSYKELLHEVYTLSQLSHPNIVQYYHSWIELEDTSLSFDTGDDDIHSVLLDTGHWNSFRSTSVSNFDDCESDISIDSSITAITFTEYALTSECSADNFDVSDDATDNDFGPTSPFIEDAPQRKDVIDSKKKVTLYIQMELCTNTLHDYLNQRERVHTKESLHIFTQILVGVSYLHDKNLVHRDLRPSNIFIFENAQHGGCVVKIGDFSVSTDEVPYLYTHKRKSGTQVFGDYQYASPEQIRGEQCLQSTDIFSLGIILFELFYNCTPNRDRVLRELRKRILPPELLMHHAIESSVILWLLSPSPAERPKPKQILGCKLFEDNAAPEHVVVPKQKLEDLDKKLQTQENTIQQQENIIKEQEERIKLLLQDAAAGRASV